MADFTPGDRVRIKDHEAFSVALDHEAIVWRVHKSGIISIAIPKKYLKNVKAWFIERVKGEDYASLAVHPTEIEVFDRKKMIGG